MTAYLADIFHYLNELNLSLQEKRINMLKAPEKLNSFIGKLPLWSCRLQGGNLANFLFLNEIFVEGGASLQRDVLLEMVARMESLSAGWSNFFTLASHFSKVFKLVGLRRVDIVSLGISLRLFLFLSQNHGVL